MAKSLVGGRDTLAATGPITPQGQGKATVPRGELPPLPHADTNDDCASLQNRYWAINNRIAKLLDGLSSGRIAPSTVDRTTGEYADAQRNIKALMNDRNCKPPSEDPPETFANGWEGEPRERDPEKGAKRMVALPPIPARKPVGTQGVAFRAAGTAGGYRSGATVPARVMAAEAAPAIGGYQAGAAVSVRVVAAEVVPFLGQVAGSIIEGQAAANAPDRTGAWLHGFAAGSYAIAGGAAVGAGLSVEAPPVAAVLGTVSLGATVVGAAATGLAYGYDHREDLVAAVKPVVDTLVGMRASAVAKASDAMRGYHAVTKGLQDRLAGMVASRQPLGRVVSANPEKGSSLLSQAVGRNSTGLSR